MAEPDNVIRLQQQFDREMDSDNSNSESRRGRPSVATQIVELVQREARELCHDSDGVPYARWGDQPHVETWPLDSRVAHEWISHKFYRAHGAAPRAQALSDAIATLAGIARYDSSKHDVYLRTARLNESVVHDVGDDGWSAVTITAKGWSVGASPVIFRRPIAARATAFPVKDGKIGDVIDRLELPTNDARHVITWAVATIIGDHAVPVLEISGPAGAGKTTLLRRIRSMIDPHDADARAAPRSIEDLYVAARHSYLVTADNLSHISTELSDALCVLCTGGGYARRTLYTTQDETVLRARRPILVTGVAPVITASDLLDRTIAISLTFRDDQDRATEAQLESEWAQALPQTMGTLYDLAAEVLRERSTVDLKSLPRMADYAIVGETISRCVGWPSYAEQYASHRHALAARGVESSPVASTLLEYMRNNSSYAGSVGGLANKLAQIRTESDAWPRSVRGVADAIRRAAPGLQSAGLAIHWDEVRRMDGYHIRVSRTSDWGT
jgi:hypothetical protein